MEYIKLAGVGLRISRVGIGMWQASGRSWGTDVSDEDCIAAMERASSLEVNLVDTAEIYGDGHSEEVVGRALKKIGRDEFVVATKVHGGHLRYDDVITAAEKSRKRLGISEIDLYQVHWPDPWEQVPMKETFSAFDKLYQEGRISAVGVCNFSVRDLEEARRYLKHTDIVSNQIHYSLLHREPEKEVLPYCEKEGIAVLAWSPIAKGILTGKYTEKRRPSDEIRRDDVLFKPHNLREARKLLAVIKKIAEDRKKTPAQVALNWLMRKKLVIPIPGAKRPEQAAENARAVGWKLTAKEIEAMTAVADSLKLDTF